MNWGNFGLFLANLRRQVFMSLTISLSETLNLYGCPIIFRFIYFFTMISNEITHTGCFFLFWHVWHSHILINFWPKIMFLDIFHIFIPFIFCKKNYRAFVSLLFILPHFKKSYQFWGKFSKIITFLKKSQQNCHNFMISTKIYVKIAFSNSKHCKQY